MTSHSSASRFYVGNRRDSAKLLSSALVITEAGLIRFDHPVGKLIALVTGLLSGYWLLCYRKLQH
jgi:hypothetical protein